MSDQLDIFAAIEDLPDNEPRFDVSGGTVSDEVRSALASGAISPRMALGTSVAAERAAERETWRTDPARRSTRERREARAERLRSWADGQERKGTARVEAARAVADMIPLGQPMMPGHHSYRADVNRRARMRSNWDKGFEALNKAESMRSRAANIEAAAAHAIYSDDDDAVPALEARIAALEAERAAVKAYNVSCRKGAPCPDLLLPQQRAKLEQVQRYSPCPRDDGSLPGYVLSNLSGNIKRNRDRLAQLRRGAS